MNTAKRIAAVVLLGTGTVIVSTVAAWLLVDDATLVGALVRQLHAGGSVQVRYEGEARVIRTLTPTLSIGRLRVEDVRSRYRIETESLRVQVSLPRLLLGQLDIPLLHLGDTRITLGQPDPAAGPQASRGAPGVEPLRFRPALHDVKIGRIQVFRDDGELQLPAVGIDEIAVDLASDTGTLQLTAQVELAGETLQIEASLPELPDAWRRQTVACSVSAATGHVRLGADGKFDLGGTDPAVEADIHIDAADLSGLDVGIDGLTVPGSLVAHARLAGPLDRPALQALSAVWQGPEASALKLTGRVDNLVAFDGIRLQFEGRLHKPHWLMPLLPDNAGSPDNVSLSAGISGTYQRLAVRDFSFGAKTADGLNLSLEGRFDIVAASTGQQPANFDLALTFAAPTTRAARVLLFEQIPELGEITGTADIRADAEVPGLENIVVRTKDKQGVTTDLGGSIARVPLDPAQPGSGYDLDVLMKVASTKVMAGRLGIDLPVSGPSTLAFRIEGDTRALVLNRIRLNGGDERALQFGAQGRVQFGNWSLPDPLKSVDLKLQANSADTASLGKLLGTTLPELGALDAEARLHTVSGIHRIDGVRIQTREGAPLKASLAGTVNNVSLFPAVAVEGIRLKGEAVATDVSTLNSVFGLHDRIPALGPFTARARIQDKDGLLNVESAMVRIGDDTAPVVKATGFVDDLTGAGKTRWDVRLHIDSRKLAEQGGRPGLSELGVLTGGLVIANSDGPLGMESLTVRSAQTEALNLAVSGRFSDFEAPETLSITATLKARDLQSIGAMVDQDWPAVGPVEMKSSIAETGEITAIKTEMSAGDMHVSAALSADFDASPPRISGGITARELLLPDPLDETAGDGGKEDAAGSAVFSETPLDFDWIGKADLDLAVDVASFSGEKSSLESARFVITQKAGHLAVSPATLVYAQGRLELALDVDTKDTPKLGFRASGENLNPWTTLDISKGGETLRTAVDVDIAATTAGASPHELAANLDGDIYLTMRNGKIRRKLLELLLFDVVGWTYSKTTQEKYYDIDCGVADYAINKGLITTRAFLLDSKRIAISGEGTIDLGRERIDYALLPRKKSQLIVEADPVKITGALGNPSVRAIPWKTAATTYGTLIFAPYVFVGLTAADYLSGALDIGKKKSSPCLDYKQRHKSRSETPEP